VKPRGKPCAKLHYCTLKRLKKGIAACRALENTSKLTGQSLYLRQSRGLQNG